MGLRIVVESLVGALIAGGVFVFIRLNPQHYRTALAAGAILTAGWVQGQGYVLMDELLLFAMTFGVLASERVWSARQFFWGRTFSQQSCWVTILLVYLMVHGLYGVAIHGDWTLVRWPALYFALILAWVIWSSRVVEEGGDDVRVSLMAWMVAGYFGMMLIHWLALETVLEIRWETMQAVTWAGSTYAFFPALIALPVALILLRKNAGSSQWLSYSVIALVSLCAGLYSSRASIITLLLFIAIAFVSLPWRRSLNVALLVIIIHAAAVWTAAFVHLGHAGMAHSDRYFESARQVLRDFGKYVPMVSESLRMPYAPRDSDVDRYAHLVCVNELLFHAELPKVIFGYGQDRHKVELARCSKLRGAIALPDSPVRSTAVTAFAISYGVCGLALLMVSCFANIKHLVASSNNAVATVPFYLLALLWGMLTDYRDQVLVYLVVIFNLLGAISSGGRNIERVKLFGLGRPGASC